MRLGVLLDGLACGADVVVADGQLAGGQADIRPAQGEQLGTAGLDLIQSQRTAAARVALMAKWTWRMVPADSGWQACPAHSITAQPTAAHSCGGEPPVPPGARGTPGGGPP